MADFPAVGYTATKTAIHCGSLESLGDMFRSNGGIPSATSATWPAANRAIYIPFYLEYSATAYQMATIVSIQSGNCDVGIYDETGARLVSMGSTAVAAAGIQLFNIADTALTPGTYFMAMCVDNTTASYPRNGSAASCCRLAGVQQQAVGAVTLPSSATFAASVGYVPGLSVSLAATV